MSSILLLSSQLGWVLEIPFFIHYHISYWTPALLLCCSSKCALYCTRKCIIGWPLVPREIIHLRDSWAPVFLAAEKFRYPSGLCYEWSIVTASNVTQSMEQSWPSNNSKTKLAFKFTWITTKAGVKGHNLAGTSVLEQHNLTWICHEFMFSMF